MGPLYPDARRDTDRFPGLTVPAAKACPARNLCGSAGRVFESSREFCNIKFVVRNNAIASLHRQKSSARDEVSQLNRDVKKMKNREGNLLRRMRDFVCITAVICVLHTPQIIYILAALVIKKDVTVASEKSSPGGDM